jgi:flagellar biosynthetic protein FliR
VEQILEALAPQALLFVLIMVRIGAMLATAPPFAGGPIPNRVKAGLAVLLAWVALPLTPGAGQAIVAPHPLEVVMLAGKELVIGVAFGLIVRMAFAAVTYAGMITDFSAGFALAQAIDPTTGTQVSVLGRWYGLITTAVFLAIGGAQWLAAGIVRSFVLVPPLETPDFSALILGVTRASDDIFLIAIQLAAPLMVALVITDVTLGLMSRAVPQMNVFIVGLPLKIVVALAGTAILLPTMVTYLDTLSGRLIEDLSTVMRAAGG